MREILFRGKRADNGEWLEGYYTELPVGSLAATIASNDEETVCEDTASYIIKVFATQHSNYSNGYPLEVIECENYEVIPETLGQYTGGRDKLGNKIFEGDIVKTYDEIYVVTWDNQKAMFYLRNARVSADFYHYFSTDLDIIGNIHDNLELIGGDDND